MNFNIFGGFQKNKYFLGYEDFVDIFWGSSQNWTIFSGHFYAFLGIFFPGGGGGTLIFLYIRRLGPFFWGLIFEFQYFFGFSEK